MRLANKKIRLSGFVWMKTKLNFSVCEKKCCKPKTSVVIYK